MSIIQIVCQTFTLNNKHLNIDHGYYQFNGLAGIIKNKPFIICILPFK